MKHNYNLYKRGGTWGNGDSMAMPEEAILTLLANREIEHVHTSHVGADRAMHHYFKFKD